MQRPVPSDNTNADIPIPDRNAFQLLNTMPVTINPMPAQTIKGSTSPSSSIAQSDTSAGTMPRVIG